MPRVGGVGGAREGVAVCGDAVFGTEKLWAL